MTHNVEAISVDANVHDAAHRMAALDIGFLVVIDEVKPVGVLTDRDVTIRVVAEGRDPQQTRVEDVMTADLVTMDEDQEVEEAAHLMEEKQIRRLVVRSGENRYVGVVSLGDLAVSTHDTQLSGEALEKISEPAHPNKPR